MTSHHPDGLNTTTGAGLQSPAQLDSIGKSWGEPEDEYLIGVSTQSTGLDAANQTPAVLEMQRRLKCSIERLTEQAAVSAAEQLEQQRQLTAALRAFDQATASSAAAAAAQSAELITLSKQADRQTRKMIGLTWAIALLTVALLILTFELAGK